ncbi:MAG: uncharacterized protein KVP18_000776 [Porospora cf. gigantea A]|nr:MAG: hypothetical protein KVP18_000776 [Porospora cf. gigantea A]
MTADETMSFMELKERTADLVHLEKTKAQELNQTDLQILELARNVKVSQEEEQCLKQQVAELSKQVNRLDAELGAARAYVRRLEAQQAAAERMSGVCREAAAHLDQERDQKTAELRALSQHTRLPASVSKRNLIAHPPPQRPCLTKPKRKRQR